MSAISVSVIAFALILGSMFLGILLRPKVPDAHLSGDSKEVIRLATALIATMSAVVLALLFASTRTSYEQTSSYVSRLTADMIALDDLLSEYGPEAAPLRKVLRADVDPLIDSIWREAAAGGEKQLRPPHTESVLYMLRALVPQTPVQDSLRARALELSTDMSQTRLILYAQPADSISRPFGAVLVLWLMFIFATFSMSAKANATLISVLCLCVLSAAAAMYLISELGQPFDGLLQISSSSLRNALPPLDPSR